MDEWASAVQGWVPTAVTARTEVGIWALVILLNDFVKQRKKSKLLLPKFYCRPFFLHVKPFACDEHQRGNERDQLLARSESWWKKQFHCYTGTYLIKYPASVTLNCDPKISKITFSFFHFFSKTRYSHIRPLFGGRQFPIFFLATGRGGQSESTRWWRPHRSSSPLLLPVWSESK